MNYIDHRFALSDVHTADMVDFGVDIAALLVYVDIAALLVYVDSRLLFSLGMKAIDALDARLVMLMSFRRL
jgi:hypothetical protein